jgi:tetratricopeptide (TPR) repeat protein
MKKIYFFLCLSTLLFWTTSKAAVPTEALKIFPIQWSGTDAIRAANYQQALQVLKEDTLEIDTAFYFLKLGIIHSRLNNRMTALPYLKLAAQKSPLLAPIAFMIIGDLEYFNQQRGNAFDAYFHALYKECPTAYQNYIFERVKKIYDTDSSTFIKDPRCNGFMEWIKNVSPPKITNVKSLKIDSLINAQLWKPLDTLLDTTTFTSDDSCQIIEKIFQKVPLDSLRLTSLFSCAQKALTCGKTDIAENLLEMIEKSGNKVMAAKALNFHAKATLNKNDYDKALRLFKKYYNHYGPDSDVIMSIARCYKKKGNDFEASRWYDKHIAQFPTHSKTQEILWLQAWQKESKNKYAAAGSLYKKIYTKFKSGNRRDESYIRHALCYYRMEKFDSTIFVLSSFVKKFPTSSFYPAAVFWKGKAYIEKENDSMAMSCLSQVATYDPFDYYAFRARYYLSTFDTLFSVPLDTTSDMQSALKWIDTLKGNQSTKFSKSDSLNYQRAMICGSLGIFELAEHFFNAIEINSQDLGSQFKIALFYSACGATGQAFKIMRRIAWKIPLEQRSFAPIGIYMLLYPSFYSGIIVNRAKEEQIDPNLVSAVMRQESIFNPEIVSPAGAIGLMQIMPYTAETLAEDLKIPFIVDSLYNPSYNIRLGTYYLRQLLEKFNNNFVLVLSSYNAGPHNAKKWYESNKSEEFDLFVEDIEFTETRGYVKKVMGNYWSYQELCRFPGFKLNYFSKPASF